jgi:hypothetical protein
MRVFGARLSRAQRAARYAISSFGVAVMGSSLYFATVDISSSTAAP